MIEGNAIISFDFKDKFVKLLSYSNKSINSNVLGTNLKNWSIEQSNDGQNWIEIDRHD